MEASSYIIFYFGGVTTLLSSSPEPLREFVEAARRIPLAITVLVVMPHRYGTSGENNDLHDYKHFLECLQFMDFSHLDGHIEIRLDPDFCERTNTILRVSRDEYRTRLLKLLRFDRINTELLVRSFLHPMAYEVE